MDSITTPTHNTNAMPRDQSKFLNRIRDNLSEIKTTDGDDTEKQTPNDAGENPCDQETIELWTYLISGIVVVILIVVLGSLYLRGDI